MFLFIRLLLNIIYLKYFIDHKDLDGFIIINKERGKYYIELSPWNRVHVIRKSSKLRKALIEASIEAKGFLQ